MRRLRHRPDMIAAAMHHPTGSALGNARWLLPSLVGLLVAVVAIVVLRTSGSLRGSVDALVIMGFDVDRGILITGLIAGAIAALLVTVCAGHPAVAVLASAGASGAVFAKTFLRESSTAMAARGPAGIFDPVGWLASLAALIVVAVIVGWAATVLTATVRRFVVAAVADARDAVRVRPIGPSRLVRPLVVVATLVLLGATLPIFADMVNYTADAHMRSGGVPVAGLADGGVDTHPSPGPQRSSSPGSASPSGSPNPSASAPSTPGDPGHLPTDLVPGPVAGSLITGDVVTTRRPWVISVPTGPGQVSRIRLPAPWTQGSTTVAIVDVYLPPGYGTSSTRYPVLYEAPYAMPAWNTAIGVKSTLDALINSGAIPPIVVVFASEFGGPYRDAECSDSYDGREHFDTYVSKQLVSYMDAHYRTIAAPAARAMLGDSQGGYCSVALWSHHPDVFASAISFSGYFVSGIVSSSTRNASLPFGRNAAYEVAQSPINIVPQLPTAVRDRSFVVLSGGTDKSVFASQLRTFAAVLDAAHVPMALLTSPFGHSWQTARDLLPTALELLAGRMVNLGVFGP